METLQIDIIEPRAKTLLEDLAKLDLISIRQDLPAEPKGALEALLKKWRANSDGAPTLDEITSEVEAVRSERYSRK